MGNEISIICYETSYTIQTHYIDIRTLYVLLCSNVTEYEWIIVRDVHVN